MEALADEVVSWLMAAWDPSLTVGEWWARCAEAGWLFPSWPRGLGGRGLSVAETRTVYGRFVAAGALGPPRGAGQQIGGAVVLARGTPSQHTRLLPGLISGQEAWCQLFSEPSAGSDLASVRTIATHDGRSWRLTGHKTWVTGGKSSHRGFLLARTDPDAPRHHGLSWFVVDLRQPGVHVQPVPMMNGWRFDEALLDDVEVDDLDLIGGPGDGWALAMETLRYERMGLIGRVKGLVTAPPGLRTVRRPAGEVVADSAPKAGDILAPRREWTAAGLGGLAAERPDGPDQLQRQALARAWILSSVTNWTRRRDPSPVSANLTKLAQSHQVRAARDTAPWLLGPHATLAGPDAPHGGAFTDMVITAPSQSLVGGTDEIQRNLIAERGLGLPRDPNRS